MNDSVNICVSASSNITRQYWLLEGENVTLGLVLAVYLLLCELVALPWNVLVVVTIIKEKLYHQPNAILLLNLIVADLFILIVPTPLMMTTGFAGELLMGSSDEERCNSCRFSFFLHIPIFSSSFTVALMSLDRFFYIYSPFKYERSSTKYVAGAAVLVSIAVSIALGFVIGFTPGSAHFIKPLLLCAVMYDHPSLLVPSLVVTILLTTLVVIIVSNACFSRIVLKNIRAVYSHNDNDSKRQKWQDKLKKRVASTRHKKQRRLCGMIFLLLFASAITLVPLLILMLRFHFEPSSNLPGRGTLLILMLNYSQVFLHPIIETSFISDIRRPMWNMLTCGYLKRKGDQDSQDRWKLFSVCSACTKEGGKCSFLCTVIEAAVIPRGKESSVNSST